jgi:hypothetical protein
LPLPQGRRREREGKKRRKGEGSWELQYKVRRKNEKDG